MTPTGRLWLLGVPVLLLAACISFDDSRTEFCRTADEPRRVVICGASSEDDVDAPDAGTGSGTDAGTGSGADAGTGSGTDAGTAGSCTRDAQCTTPPNQCHEVTGTCVSGKCQYAEKQTGASCSDATPTGECYSTSGTCQAGVCRASYKPAGTTCDDGDLCTENDKCNSTGGWKGKGKVCNSPSGPCYQYQGTCESHTGACVYAPQPSGTECSPTNMCKTGRCNDSGQCLETGDVYCDPCMTFGTCEPSRGCIPDSSCADSGCVCVGGSCRSPGGGVCHVI